MTKLVWCEQGHRYDKELSPDCPVCREGGAPAPDVDLGVPRHGERETPGGEVEGEDEPARGDDADRPAESRPARARRSP